MISIIAAVARNRVIGNGPQIPWHLASDFAYFKEKTSGHPIILGKNTHDSIGLALPGRTNIVIADDPSYRGKLGAVVVFSLEEAVEQGNRAPGSEEIFIAGGAMVYAQTISRADRIYLTDVKAEPEGDKFFPQIDLNVWQEVSRTSGTRSEKDDHDFDFVIYERKV